MKVDYVKGTNVVSIQPVRRQLHFPAVGVVEAYWEGLRDGRQMPARAEVDPRGIAGVLEFAFVLEKIAPGLARIRLAGMHLNELMAMEVRGMPLTALFLPEARRELQRVVENLLAEPAMARLGLAAPAGMGRPPLEAQMLLLPLRDDAGAPTRVLGALQSRGEIGRGPRRFVIRDIETRAITAARAAAPRAEARTPAPAEPGRLTRRLDAATRAPEAAPRLRLVHDADRA